MSCEWEVDGRDGGKGLGLESGNRLRLFGKMWREREREREGGGGARAVRL